MADAIASAQPCATEHESSPAAGPALSVEQSHAAWVALVKAGATRICLLLADALDDEACDRADSILFFMKCSEDASLWNDGPYAVALLCAAADTLVAGKPIADVAVAVRPAAIKLLNELAIALDVFQASGDVSRLAAFADYTLREAPEHGQGAGSDAGQPDAPVLRLKEGATDAVAWGEFIRIYRQHIEWLLAHSDGAADDVSKAAQMSNILARSAGRGARTSELSTQAEAAFPMATVYESIREAVKTAGEDQTWLWDRAMAMASDFSDSASSLVESYAISAKHALYLADFAEAQAMLLRILSSSAERWEADKPEQRMPEAELNGFTAEQVQEAIEAIATNAETLREFLMEARHRAEGEFSGAGVPRASGDFYMAQQSASMIGAMADELAGGHLVGNALSWMTMSPMQPRGAQ